jgi:hypothetical protein
MSTDATFRGCKTDDRGIHKFRRHLIPVPSTSSLEPSESLGAISNPFAISIDARLYPTYVSNRHDVLPIIITIRSRQKAEPSDVVDSQKAISLLQPPSIPSHHPQHVINYFAKFEQEFLSNDVA